MSGYLEVKLCSKGNRGLTPWKTWKKQWCILRPSPLPEDGLTLVFHPSAGLSSTSHLEIPRHSVVMRTASRTHSHAFGVYSSAGDRKPLLLMAGHTETEAQLWMARIRALLHGTHTTDKLSPSVAGYSVSVIDTPFTLGCGLRGLYGRLVVSALGLQVMDQAQHTCRALLPWEHITRVALRQGDRPPDRDKICIITTNSECEFGSGDILLFCNAGASLYRALHLRCPTATQVVKRRLNRRISRSEGTLVGMQGEGEGDSQRDSGLSSCGPVDEDTSLRLSMDDDGLVLKAKKASTLISAGMLLSSQHTAHSLDVLSPLHTFNKPNSCLPRRCSGTSLASGIYEEIGDPPPPSPRPTALDNTYEVLGGPHEGDSCVPPPPLPPRGKNTNARLDSASDSGLDEDSLCSTPHSSSDPKWTSIHGSLPRLTHKYLDKDPLGKSSIKGSDRFQSAFGVFRKRIKSESQVGFARRHNAEHKSPVDHDPACDPSMRKRLFEFNVTPQKASNKVKDSKISRALKKLGVKQGHLNLKNSTKSCENLDFKDEPIDKNAGEKLNRCSKSEENLDLCTANVTRIRKEVNKLNLSAEWCSENSVENAKDLSLLYSEESIKNAYPGDLLDLLLKGKLDELEVRLKQRSAEEEYMLMSPCRVRDQTSPVLQQNVCVQQQPDSQNDTLRHPTSNLESNYVVMKSA